MLLCTAQCTVVQCSDTVHKASALLQCSIIVSCYSAVVKCTGRVNLQSAVVSVILSSHLKRCSGFPNTGNFTQIFIKLICLSKKRESSPYLTKFLSNPSREELSCDMAVLFIISHVPFHKLVSGKGIIKRIVHAYS